MKKSVLTMLSLIVLSLFIVACAPSEKALESTAADEVAEDVVEEVEEVVEEPADVVENVEDVEVKPRERTDDVIIRRR